jgi:hypothetical protein
LAAKLQSAPEAYSKPFNFGPLPDDHLTVRQLVEKAIEVWGKGSWSDLSDSSQPHEATLLKLSIDRAGKSWAGSQGWMQARLLNGPCNGIISRRKIRLTLVSSKLNLTSGYDLYSYRSER